jgi:hypothetical protein
LEIFPTHFGDQNENLDLLVFAGQSDSARSRQRDSTAKGLQRPQRFPHQVHVHRGPYREVQLLGRSAHTLLRAGDSVNLKTLVEVRHALKTLLALESKPVPIEAFLGAVRALSKFDYELNEILDKEIQL